MQNPPQMSPDGAYWWDGHAWQPMPVQSAPAAETPRPSWLPEGVSVPTPRIPEGIPLISQPAFIGAAASPAIFAPAWANETPPVESLSLTKKILNWAGLVLSGAFLLLGVFSFPFIALRAVGTERDNALAGAVLIIIIGGAFFVPCLAVLLGLGPVVGTTLHSLGIAGCLVVLGMVLNTALVLTTPVGAARYVVPWGTFMLVVFRAWRGRWLGACIIGGVWLVGAAITLTIARH